MHALTYVLIYMHMCIYGFVNIVYLHHYAIIARDLNNHFQVQNQGLQPGTQQ